MSTPTAGNPPVVNQPQGDSPTPGQPTPPQPTPAPAAPAANAPGTSPPAPPTAPVQPTPQEIEALRKELEQTRASARHFQSQADRFRAALGAPPQQPDPMQARIKAYTDKGYSEDDARFFISQIDAAVQPLQQQNQHLQAQVQGTSLAQQVMQAAIDANPELFADPKILNAAYVGLQTAATSGNIQLITPDYAKYLGAQEWALAKEPWKQQSPAPPAAPMPGYQPFRVAFNGPSGNGYPPPPPTSQAPAQDPNVAALAARMAQGRQYKLNQ